MPSYAWIVSTGETWLNDTQRVVFLLFIFIQNTMKRNNDAVQH